MQIWISNTRSTLTYEREFFSLIRENLRERRGLRVSDRFQSICALSDLPWLDQPCHIDPTLFAMEVYAAWDELWTTRLNELRVQPRPDSAFEFDWSSDNLTEKHESFGRYLAAPLHALASFAAATARDCLVRASIHRQLIVGPERRLRDWRVLRGGRSGPVPAAHLAAPLRSNS